MPPEITQLSQAAYDRLKAEYDDLTTRGRIDIARKIETARELGDLSENGDYHAAKEEQGKMQGRTLHLPAILENHAILGARSGRPEDSVYRVVTSPVPRSTRWIDPPVQLDGTAPGRVRPIISSQVKQPPLLHR